MIHHVVLFKLKPEVTPEKLEEMMRQTRISLLKIGEVLSVKCGKNIDPASDWGFFIAVDFESMEKLAIYREDAIHIKYVEEVIKPNTDARVALDYEMEPGKDVKYS
ncbi:MAG: Dabb family protein [Verrucomicrobiota bacterium]